MNKMFVLGIGRRIMTDDAIGIRLVEDLRRHDVSPYTRYFIGEAELEYCFEEVLDCDYLVIINAYISGKNPGELSIIPINELDSAKEISLHSAHGKHLFNMLRGSKHLPEGLFIGIEPCEVNYGFTLSDTLQACYPDIMKKVKGLVCNKVGSHESANAPK